MVHPPSYSSMVVRRPRGPGGDHLWIRSKAGDPGVHGKGLSAELSNRIPPEFCARRRNNQIGHSPDLRPLKIPQREQRGRCETIASQPTESFPARSKNGCCGRPPIDTECNGSNSCIRCQAHVLLKGDTGKVFKMDEQLEAFALYVKVDSSRRRLGKLRSTHCFRGVRKA